MYCPLTSFIANARLTRMNIRRTWNNQEPYLSAHDLVAALKDFQEDYENLELDREAQVIRTLAGIFEFLLVVDEPA